MPTGTADDIAFGPFRLDAQRRRLTRGGVPVPLGGRAFDTLALLAAAGGETVPKQILLDHVWPGLAVEENNLQVQVSTLRKALGAGWIVNVPGRGYRLAPPPGAPTADSAEFPGPPDLAAIAVLPFLNMSGDPEQEYFADGMAEEITTALSRLRSLFVIARNSSFTYKGRTVDVKQVGRELGVRYVLEGSVRKAGKRLRITAQLADATDGAQLWADRFDGLLEDVFDLQDRVTASVVGAIEPRIRAVEIRRAQRKPPESLQAYDFVLRALPLAYRMREEDTAEAKRLLRRAVDIDPTYALAFARLAACHWMEITQGWTQDIVLATTEIVRLAALALENGRDDPEVLASISHRIALPGGDLNGGIALAEQALALNPNSAEALTNGAHLYGYAGEADRAIAYVERAARLNPLEGFNFRYLAAAIAHFAVGRHAQVVEATELALRDFPNHAAALRYRAASLGLLGRVTEGRAVVRQLRRIMAGFTIARGRAHLEIHTNNAFRPPGVVDAFCEGLRRVGVPE